MSAGFDIEGFVDQTGHWRRVGHRDTEEQAVSLARDVFAGRVRDEQGYDAVRVVRVVWEAAR